MGTEYAEQLETIRNLIVVGWMLLALGWAVQLGFDAREAKPKTGNKYELCKLHQRPTHECRDMHSHDD